MLRLALLAALVATQTAAEYRPNTEPLPNAVGAVGICAAKSANNLSIGTAWLFHADNAYLYYLTCSHVLGNPPAAHATLQLYTDGLAIRPIDADVLYASNPDRGPDVAILAAPAAQLPNTTLQPIDTTRTDRPKPGEILITIGSAKAQWPTLLVSRIQDAQDDKLRFRPQPAEGRSGSPILDAKGRCTGVLTWRDPTVGEGIAQAWPTLKDHLATHAPRTKPTQRPQQFNQQLLTTTQTIAYETFPYLVPLTEQECAQCPGPDCPWPLQLLPRQRRPQPKPETSPEQPGNAIPWPPLEPPANPSGDETNDAKKQRQRPFLKPAIPLEAEPTPPTDNPEEPTKPTAQPRREKRALRAAADAVKAAETDVQDAVASWRQAIDLASRGFWLLAAIAAVTAAYKTFQLYLSYRKTSWPTSSSTPPPKSTTNSAIPSTGTSNLPTPPTPPPSQ